MAQKLIRHELVEILIPKGSSLTKYVIPDLPNLRNVHLFGLEVYSKECIEKGIQTGNNLLKLVPVLQQSYITLVNYGGKEFLKQAPSTMFKTIFNQDISGAVPPGNTINQFEWNVKNFVGQKVNYPKSYIEFTTSPSSLTEDLVYMFSIFYSLPVAEEKKESGYGFGKAC